MCAGDNFCLMETILEYLLNVLCVNVLYYDFNGTQFERNRSRKCDERSMLYALQSTDKDIL